MRWKDRQTVERWVAYTTIFSLGWVLLNGLAKLF